jgi:hypothetical protein
MQSCPSKRSRNKRQLLLGRRGRRGMQHYKTLALSVEAR